MGRRIFLIFVIAFVVNGFWCNTFAQSGRLNGHGYVDLGLPSGTKWATCNVGANYPREYGNYYAWGETYPKNFYGYNNYTYYYDPVILPANADVAAVNWGHGWRMPTENDFRELLDECEWIWMPSIGYKVVGPNNNSILLPAAGYINGDELYYGDEQGFYLSGSIYSEDYNYARYLNFYPQNYYFYVDIHDRYYGFPVRPVCK